MVRIRLRRMGAKRRPFYRLVVAESSAPRDGRFIEEVGTYDPTRQPAEVKIQEERVIHWIRQGAQPTDTVRSLLQHQGILRRLAEERRGSHG